MWLFVVALNAAIPRENNNDIHEEGRCVLYGQDLNSVNAPFINNTLALPIESDYDKQSLISICGDYGRKLVEMNKVCCSSSQIQKLAAGLNLAVPVISGCPACFSNFARFYCTFTCSPNQSLFVNVTRTLEIDPKLVGELDMHVQQEKMNGIFQSCENVQLTSANTLARNFLAPGANNFTEFFKSLGTPDNRMKFIKMNFPSHTESPLKPYGNEMWKTYDCTGNVEPSFKCSCTDCLGVCKALDVEKSIKHGTCYISSLDLECISFSLIVLYILAVAGIIFFMGIKRIFKKPKNLWVHEFDHDEFENESSSELNSAATLEKKQDTIIYYSWWLDSWAQKLFYQIGKLCASEPASVIFFWCIVCGLGWARFEVETNPIRLWVNPQSKALAQKNFFDLEFEPFYRITQIIIKNPNEEKGIKDVDFLSQAWDLQDVITNIVVPEGYIPLKTADGTKSHLKVYNVTLKDICFQPLPKSEVADELACMIQSFNQWHENRQDLTKDFDKLKLCIQSPGNPYCMHPYPVEPKVVLGGVTRKKSIDKNSEDLTLDEWLSASSVIITYIISNPLNDTATAMASIWEKEVIRILKLHQSNNTFPLLSYSFSTESSLEEELASETSTDIPTVLLSYFVMFLYASIALGKYDFTSIQRNPLSVFVQSRFTLGICGILIVVASIVISGGVLSTLGFKATLIIGEVIPFLVLAVGVDNIFIIVSTFDRVTASTKQYHLSVEKRIALALSQVGPSILLSSTCETIAFALGVTVPMPAVSVFSLYASAAVLVNFLLQISCFVAIFTLDSKRAEDNYLDCFPCVKISTSPYQDIIQQDPHLERHPLLPFKTVSPRKKASSSAMEYFFRNIYAPFILDPVVKTILLILFLTGGLVAWFGLDGIELGLDQKTALPSSSYLTNYFTDIETELEVGPPLYFVVAPKNDSVFDFYSRSGQELVCGRYTDCPSDSIPNVLSQEYAKKYWNISGNASIANYQETTLAFPVANWFDDFVAHVNTPGVPCSLRSPLTVVTDKYDQTLNISFRGATKVYHKWRSLEPYRLNMLYSNRFIRKCDGRNSLNIGFCNIFDNYVFGDPNHPDTSVGGLPKPNDLFDALMEWKSHRTTPLCPSAGFAAYNKAISVNVQQKRVKAFHYRTYHKPLSKQSDFIKAYKDALALSDLIRNQSLKRPEEYTDHGNGFSVPEVFPYSIFYVFFEQYMFIVDMLSHLIPLVLLCLFIVTLVLVGSPITSILIVFTVALMLIDIVAMMSLFGVSMNALSAVNLCIAAGIGVEFCIHVARSVTCHPTVCFLCSGSSCSHNELLSPSHEDDPVRESIAEMGSNVFCGITITKLLGVLILAFAQSKIFIIYYHRMYLLIVLICALHGLVFLPILMDLFGIGEWKDARGRKCRGNRIQYYLS